MIGIGESAKVPPKRDPDECLHDGTITGFTAEGHLVCHQCGKSLAPGSDELENALEPARREKREREARARARNARVLTTGELLRAWGEDRFGLAGVWRVRWPDGEETLEVLWGERGTGALRTGNPGLQDEQEPLWHPCFKGCEWKQERSF